jgi:hypothetical protein
MAYCKSRSDSPLLSNDWVPAVVGAPSRERGISQIESLGRFRDNYSRDMAHEHQDTPDMEKSSLLYPLTNAINSRSSARWNFTLKIGVEKVQIYG